MSWRASSLRPQEIELWHALTTFGILEDWAKLRQTKPALDLEGIRRRLTTNFGWPTSPLAARCCQTSGPNHFRGGRDNDALRWRITGSGFRKFARRGGKRSLFLDITCLQQPRTCLCRGDIRGDQKNSRWLRWSNGNGRGNRGLSRFAKPFLGKRSGQIKGSGTHRRVIGTKYALGATPFIMDLLDGPKWQSARFPQRLHFDGSQDLCFDR